MSGILDEQEVMERLYDYVQSSKYWIIIALSYPNATYALGLIEEKYYKPGTEANKDFEIIFGTVFQIAAFTKNRITRKQLEKVVKQRIPEGRDIIFLSFAKDDKTAMMEEALFESIKMGLSDVKRARTEG